MKKKLLKNKDVKEEFFVYKPRSTKNISSKKMSKTNKNNPFQKLSELRFR